MIGAVAQGIRLAQSKLRYHVQDFSFCMVSIVRGKEVWRLTGAHGIDFEGNTKSGTLHIKILKLLKRLLQGEEKNEKLFEIVEALYARGANEQNVAPLDLEREDDEIIECLTVLRILNILGYISSGNLTHYLKNNSLSKDIINEAKRDKSRIVMVINSALKESQL